MTFKVKQETLQLTAYVKKQNVIGQEITNLQKIKK